jgi:hypothetical protein
MCTSRGELWVFWVEDPRERAAHCAFFTACLAMIACTSSRGSSDDWGWRYEPPARSAQVKYWTSITLARAEMTRGGKSTYLAVVHREVEVVQCVVCRAVDDFLKRVASDEVRVVDQDGPEVDGDKETKVNEAVEGEDEDDAVIRNGLEISVERVEGICGERARNW